MDEEEQPADEAVAETDAAESNADNAMQAAMTDEAAESEQDVAQAVAEAVDSTSDPLADDDSGQFESPEQVLGEDMIDQLQKMLDQVSAGEDPMASTDEQVPADSIAAASDDSIDATTADAEALKDDLSELADQIDGAMTAAAQPNAEAEASADESDVDAEAIQEMIAGKSPAPAPDSAGNKPQDQAAPASSGEAIGQIDEYLAGQADSAVEGEFETVHDVMAAEQARVAGVVAAVQKEESGEATDAAAQAADEVSEAAEDTKEPAAAMADAAPQEAGEMESTPATAPAKVARSTDVEADVKPSLRDRMAGIVRVAGKTSAATLFTVCSVVNRPLQGKSEMTRKLIGYAALITLANASLLLVGKYVLGIFG